MEITIAYNTDEKYVKYLCVSVTSLISHISPENTYKIVVLTEDIGENLKELIRSAGNGKDNVSFEFINCKNLFPENLYTGKWSIAAYYRLALVDLFKDRNKILYLDCDTIVMTDVAELYKIDIAGYYFAASRDLYTFCEVPDAVRHLEYYKTVLKLNNPLNYVNAGVLLMNPKEICKDYNLEKLLNLISSYDYEACDQDVLNYIANEKKYILPFKWNFFPNLYPNSIRSDEDKKEYKEASKEPYIIHYNLKKPWGGLDVEYGDFFWKYAFDSLVAEDLWNEICERNNYRINDMWLNEVRVIDAAYAGKIDFKFYLRLIKAVVVGPFGRIKKKYKKS